MTVDQFERVVHEQRCVVCPAPIEPALVVFICRKSVSTVSCASSTFFAAFDCKGDALVYDGTT